MSYIKDGKWMLSSSVEQECDICGDSLNGRDDYIILQYVYGLEDEFIRICTPCEDGKEGTENDPYSRTS
jgi:hypothetical protein